MPRVRYVPSERVLRAGKWALVAIGVVVLALAVTAVIWLALDREKFAARDIESARDRVSLRRDLTAEQAARKALEQQIRGLGESPVVTPSDVPADTDVVVIPGPKGDRGPSCIEELGYPKCRGDEGRPGQAGSEGTPGSDGEDGAPGSPGKDGAKGEKGDKGDPGEQGPAGPAGSVTPGTYGCPDGQAMKSITVTADGSMSATCVDLPQFPGGGNNQ